MGHRPVPGQFRRLLQDLPESRLRADLPAVDILLLGLDPAGRLVCFVDLGVPLPAGVDATARLALTLRTAEHVRALRDRAPRGQGPAYRRYTVCQEENRHGNDCVHTCRYRWDPILK